MNRKAYARILGLVCLALGFLISCGSSSSSSPPPSVVLGVNNVGKLQVKWKYPTGSAIVSAPAVVDGVLYFGSSDSNLYALNAATGARLWSFTTGNAVNSSPAVANGVVYVGVVGDRARRP